VRLTLKWPLYAPDDKRELVACPEATVDVNILSATPERIRNLADRLIRRLDPPDVDRETLRNAARTILDTNQAAFVPVAWRCIENPHSPFSYGVSERQLFAFVDAHSEKAQDVQAHFVRLACDRKWGVKVALFDYWRPRQPNLSQSHFEQLAKAGSVWTSALTYVTFPDRHDAALKNSFFARLRDLNTSYPDAEFSNLLRQLDDDGFEVREKATAELEAVGERVEAQLRRSLNLPLSAEAERRVRAVLERLRVAKQPPECVNTLAYLRNLTTPEAQEILEVLAAGTADTWLRKEAAKILAEKKKRAAP
jgi:hypothetical protein